MLDATNLIGPGLTDAAPACTVAAKLVTDLGFDAVSAGPLRNARLLEQLALLWITLARGHGANRSIAFKLLRRDKLVG